MPNANNATNVSTGKPKITGGVWIAPKGTTLPTDPTTALSNDFTCLGYVSDEGVENSNEMDMSTIKAWGGAIVYRSLTELTDEFKFALIESKNVDVLKAVYGSANVTTTAGGDIKVEIVAEDPAELVWVFDMALRGNTAKRVIIPDGAVTGREAITYNDGDPISYGITVTAYPDESGKSHHEYIEDNGASF